MTYVKSRYCYGCREEHIFIYDKKDASFHCKNCNKRLETQENIVCPTNKKEASLEKK